MPIGNILIIPKEYNAYQLEEINIVLSLERNAIDGFAPLYLASRENQRKAYGRILGFYTDEGGLWSTIDLPNETAKAENGRDLPGNFSANEIFRRFIIDHSYSEKDSVWDEETNSLTLNKWALRQIYYLPQGRKSDTEATRSSFMVDTPTSYRATVSRARYLLHIAKLQGEDPALLRGLRLGDLERRIEHIIQEVEIHKP